MRPGQDIKEELRGREGEILRALGIRWPHGRNTHIHCPFPNHDDKHPSWRWDDEKHGYFCTCSQGSIIDAVIAVRGGNFVEARDWCREILGGARQGNYQGDFRHAKFGRPTKVWMYRNAKGQNAGAAARYETASGKQVIPWVPDGAGHWAARAMRRPRPLYRLPELLAAAKSAVLVVEGEKTADAAADYFQDYVVTTSAGGCKAFQYSRWDTLDGRDVVIWPDNDENGRIYAEGVAELLSKSSVSIVSVPEAWPAKWDLADPLPRGVFPDDLERLIRSAVRYRSPNEAATNKASVLARLIDDGRPVIQVAGGRLAEIADEAEDYLLAAAVPFYRRGNKLVRPVIDAVPASDDRETRVPRLTIIDDVYMRLTLARHICWERFDARSNRWVPTDPSKDIASTINARYGDWRFCAVTGIIGTPTMRRDGSLLLKPGYDARTGLILLDPPELPEIVDEPTRDDALDALDLLNELLAEFPFAGVGSRAVALSALITPVVRAALETAPMHVTTAPQAGTGKSYVFDVAAAISIGQPCPVIAAGKTEEEMEKRLGAALMAGQPLISIDNVNGELGGELLCQAIERPLITPRILGKSEIGQVQNRATFFATGNNLVLLDDMTRRAVICSLDSGEERPELRRFGGKPAHAVLMERGPYIAACLTIVRGYHFAGRPGKLAPLASFEDWSDMVRSALVWLGEDDPIVTMDKARENDPARVNFAGLVHAWAEEIGTGRNSEMTAAELIKLADEGQQGVLRSPKLREMLHDIIPEKRLNSKSLGRWLARHEDKVCDGIKLKKTADHKHGHRFYLDDPRDRLL